jgi:hypothetical protein
MEENKGEVNKEKGIKTALDNANAVTANWSESAISFIKSYPYRRFMAEDVREWAYKRGLAVPPHCRAWGGVINRAVKAGIITHDGFSSVKNPKAHRTPASVWLKTELCNV